MSLEALQPQAGHRSIESTRIYLHMSNDWLSAEYLRAIEEIEAPIGGEALPVTARSLGHAHQGRDRPYLCCRPNKSALSTSTAHTYGRRLVRWQVRYLGRGSPPEP